MRTNTDLNGRSLYPISHANLYACTHDPRPPTYE